MRAILSQNQHLVGMLVRQKADINQRNAKGYTALSWAASVQDAKTVHFLCHHKADVNIRTQDEYQTAMMIACLKGSKEVVRSLLEHRAYPTPADRETAKAYGQTAIVNILDTVLSPSKGWGRSKLSHRQIASAFGTLGSTM